LFVNGFILDENFLLESRQCLFGFCQYFISEQLLAEKFQERLWQNGKTEADVSLPKCALAWVALLGSERLARTLQIFSYHIPRQLLYFYSDRTKSCQVVASCSKPIMQPSLDLAS